MTSPPPDHTREQRDIAVAALRKHCFQRTAKGWVCRDCPGSWEIGKLENHTSDCVFARIAEIEKAAPPQDWRPIESAPRDGTLILVSWAGSKMKWVWMPLPDPPEDMQRTMLIRLTP